MTDARQAFLDRWRNEAGAHLAWGHFVAHKVTALLRDQVSPSELNVFLRMPVKPRLKDESSLLTKAFIRKSYDNPYAQVEDKVGVRFVVLLGSDIRLVERAIQEGTVFWEANLARDFEVERRDNPLQFAYQSLHYVVYSRVANAWEGVDIPEGLPCEIQIRTLTQHAYSELTHDTIFKPSVTATPEMQRAAAKSMALLEATDDYFEQVAGVIREANATFNAIADALAAEYGSRVGVANTEVALNSLLIDHYKSMTRADQFSNTLAAFLEDKPYVAERIKLRAAADPRGIYTLPAVLLVYLCVAESPNLARQDSPLSDDELQLIYSDLGLSLAVN